MVLISNETVANLFPFRTKETTLKNQFHQQNALGLFLQFSLQPIMSMKYFHSKNRN